uniref:Uncharacterized protein n=1 Tax=Trypanosoma vivax (strain Y486) TaxID=1055687 RepID=G0U2S5_TRYVY|nr:hypothetical protein TVY486_0904000 [Trypanosoma vivax Y486]
MVCITSLPGSTVSLDTGAQTPLWWHKELVVEVRGLTPRSPRDSVSSSGGSYTLPLLTFFILLCTTPPPSVIRYFHCMCIQDRALSTLTHMRTRMCRLCPITLLRCNRAFITPFHDLCQRPAAATPPLSCALELGRSTTHKWGCFSASFFFIFPFCLCFCFIIIIVPPHPTSTPTTFLLNDWCPFVSPGPVWKGVDKRTGSQQLYTYTPAPTQSPSFARVAN